MNTPHYKPIGDLAKDIGFCERTIKRWHDAGLVKRRAIKRGLATRWLYSVSDAKRVARGEA